MKADKLYYDTLRQEVEAGKITRPRNFFTLASHKDSEFLMEQSESIVVLQNKIKGLQLQVELLEKQNKELSEKNNVLKNHAVEKQGYSIDMNKLDDGDTELLYTFAQDQYNQLKKSFTRGYVSIAHVLDWTYNACGDLAFINYIRSMFQDLQLDNKIRNEDFIGLLQEYEKNRRNHNAQPTVINQFQSGSSAQVFNGPTTGKFNE